MLLVEDGGELVALSACGECRDEDARPAVGRAAQLLRGPRPLARGRGCTEAAVWSFAANERANAFYESRRSL
jgi:hypothetical protein